MKIKSRGVSKVGNALRVSHPIKSGMEFDFADDLEEMMKQLEPKSTLVVDFTKCHMINSSCLGILLHARKQVTHFNCDFKLKLKRGSDIEHLLEITKLADAFEIDYED